MKIDMHCHVREGSIDSKVPIEEFIKKLQSKGIGGMLVTDHDTYNGYRHWKNTIKGRKYKDFVVLKTKPEAVYVNGNLFSLYPIVHQLRKKHIPVLTSSMKDGKKIIIRIPSGS